MTLFVPLLFHSCAFHIQIYSGTHHFIWPMQPCTNTHTRADHKPLTFTRRVIVVISLHLLPHFHTFLYVRVCVFRCLDVLLHRYVDLSDLHRFFRWITLNWSRFEERQNNSKKKWTLIRAIHFINDIRLVGWIQRWKNVSITSMIDSTYRNLVDDATCRKCGSGPIADRLSFSSVNFIFLHAL